MSLLELRGIRHRYHPRGATVLDGVNLELNPGEIVALVGESGCGKTTLGKIAVGLVRPTEGTARFAGVETWKLGGRRHREERRGVQMVHQDPYASLNPGLTLLETLSAGMVEHGLARRRERRQRALDLLKLVGLDARESILDAYPHQLSGGQRQRIGIARALAVDPRLIVADEPVSMLDVSIRIAILDLMLRLREERGLGYLFITHDLGVVRYFASGERVGVVYFGNLVEEGTAEDLVAHPLHPYTQLLLGAVPVPDPRYVRSRPRFSYRRVDASAEPGTGCPFSGQCPLVTRECTEEKPPLTMLDGRRVACFHAGEGVDPRTRQGAVN